ncbi:pimeloyl-ACP methyl ester carboxylesterase [Novosphingobium sp. SG751A]|uniref:alpha/beta hydrolase domain-containing protein n=1 Tax=Novosphingobium sp. SG751A TaxID=2587000 RepID=UPI001556D064|nr:alpha/beta hydrolase domain-containing protein [Novosphingobium sp. SG751A]NOW46305.1 pimeloyl-ACP methyl ester carboxylesterase [Novosphingobium sp. SG751A]
MHLRHALLATTLAAALIGPQAAAQPLRWSAPVPQTATSRIFAPLVLNGTKEAEALARAGYVQEEYFINGKGAIYSEKEDGSLALRQGDVPYATRVILIRPRDPKRFNGIVHLALSHPNLAGTQWGRIDSLVLRSGAVYALAINGSDAPSRKASTPATPIATTDLPQWFDARRYAGFNIPKDDGIRWDIIGQVASALRDPAKGSPLAGWKVRRVYGSGWSFLGSQWRSWINFGFHDRYRRADGSPVIDGYLIGISAGAVDAGHVPLNSTDPVKDRHQQKLKMIDAPVIELTSEMEAITNIYPLREQTDAAKGGYRIYELGGVSHGDSGVTGQVRPSTWQLLERRHGGVEPVPVCSVEDSDSPMRDVAQAALVNIDRWVSTGVPAPRAERMQVTGKDYARDAFGNPIGGVRVAQLDVPLVRYAEPPASMCGGKIPRRNLKRLPVDPALIARTYPGGRAEYLAKFDARVDALVAGHWLLAPDAAAQKREARRFADQAFGPGRGTKPETAEGTLPSGAKWAAQVPANWNGTLLVWGRGYSAKLGAPELAPANAKALLLEKGYALLASDYGAAGWSLAEAAPAQAQAIAAFAQTYGKPKRTIAWGNSMGGLVTTALAEAGKPAVDGAIAFCPSIGGAVGMMNMALDGAYAFRTLTADNGLQLTGIADDMANGQKAQAAVQAALTTPQGRARLALAGVLGGIPGWTRRDHSRPADGDVEAQVDEIGAAFTMGIFLPRADQEKRADGVFSWNTGVDYTAQLAQSGRRGFVEALYAKAGLDLKADLARLAAGARVSAKPAAVQYMMAHYTPTAKPSVPLLSVQAMGDGATSPSLQRAYGEAANPGMFSAMWLAQAGHCGFSGEVLVASLRQMEKRLDSGVWDNPATGFVAHTPAPMLRPCIRGRNCR